MVNVRFWFYLAPFTSGAFRISPRQLADIPADARDGAPALSAGVVLKVLASEADVVASDDFLIRRHWHSCGDVARGGNGEVLYFLKEAWGFAGWHFFCWFCGWRRES